MVETMSTRSAITVIVTALGWAVLTAGPAFAHAEITTTSPAAGSSVSEISEVSITAGQELLDIGANAEGFVMTVTDSNGMYYGDGCVTVVGDTASMPVSLAAAGDYVVSFRVVAGDGHPVERQFMFTLIGDENAEQGVGFSETPACVQAQEPSTDITPWIGLATIPVIAGAIWLLVRALGKKDSEDHLD